jgi:hypothetical protein
MGDTGSESYFRSTRTERRWPASLGELSSQGHAGAGRTRDKSLLFVEDIALDKSDEPAGANHARLGAKRRSPYRPQEIDLQLQSRETFILGKSGAVRDAHCRVSYVAKHSAVKHPHRICVPAGGFEFDCGSAASGSSERETKKITDWSGEFFARRIRTLFG